MPDCQLIRHFFIIAMITQINYLLKLIEFSILKYLTYIRATKQFLTDSLLKQGGVLIEIYLCTRFY